MADKLPITTTLTAIRKHSPCEDGWEKLLKHLGKTKADNEPLAFSIILESNGIDDALWCLRALPKIHHGRIRLMACDYAERVLHVFEKQFPDDKRPRQCIEVARRFAHGSATEGERAAAGAAAGAAARAAAWAAAGAAAGAAARAAAWAAAGDAARDAAWAAARAAAGAAAGAAARAAAGDAEQKIQAELLIKYFG